MPEDHQNERPKNTTKEGAAYSPVNEKGLTGQDKRQGGLRERNPKDSPEGLRRERTHPLSPTDGRK